LELPVLKAVAMATGASPAPKVFTAHKGFETYSSRFYIEWTDKGNKGHSLFLTPGVYSQIKGPYNRRNAYGAAISYGPVLSSDPKTKPMFESIVQYAFCGKAPILSELGIDKNSISGNIKIRLDPRQKLPDDHQWALTYEVLCND
jgi:hypothetical protein